MSGSQPGSTALRCFIVGACLVPLIAVATEGDGVWSELKSAATQSSDELQVQVIADNSDQVVIGEPLQYRLRGNSSSVCYLLHLDARRRATLISPEDCSAGTAADSGVEALFPKGGTLTADYPEGQDTVYGIFSDQPLTTLESRLGMGGAVASLTQSEAEGVAAYLADSAQRGELILTAAAYDVVEAPSDTQFTTRGIIRKVVSSRSESPDTLDALQSDSGEGGQDRELASFSISNIHFDFGSDELTTDSKRELDAFGAALGSAELDGVRMRVAGHTDDVGDQSYNYELSLRRAVAVKRYLVSRYGLDTSRLDTVGHGEDKPLVSGGGDDARALNRRVEMVFVEGDTTRE